MRTKHIWVTLVCLLTLTVPSLLRAQVPTPPKTLDVAGNWTVTMKSPQSVIIMTMDATFTQDKDVIKVSMFAPTGVEMKGEGTIKGQELQWTMANITKPGDISLGFKAKLDGDSMTGEVQMGDLGTVTFSAKKMK
jgi:hypothetical protein